MSLPADSNAHARARRWKTLAPLAFFVAAGLVAYANVVNTYFLSDDFAQIGRVLTGDLSVVWGREHGGFFRPVFIASYALDAALWGRRAVGYHLTNVLLHALNSLLVSLLARRLFEDSGIADGRRRDAASLLAGLLFLLHPSHTEAVSWISGRADVLATFFGLSSLLLYLSRARTPRRFTHALALLCFALALLAKEAAAFVPAAVFLLASRADFKQGARRALVGGTKHAAPFAAVLLVYFVARTLALGSLVGGYGADHHLNFTHSMIVSQLLRFPLRALLPALLLSRATFLESRLLSPVLIAVGVLVVVIAALVLSRAQARKRLADFLRRNTFLWTLAALFLSALVPAINLRIDVFTTHGERYLYFPSAFFCVALAHVLINKTKERRRLAFVAVTCALVFYAATLWLTNQHWADAARVSRTIVNDLAAQSEQPRGAVVVVLNLPDNLDGSHLFRNGLPEALRWFADTRNATDVRVLAWHAPRSAHGGATLTDEGAGVFTLELTQEADVFGRINEGVANVEIAERGQRRLRLRLKEGTADFFYFDNGGMVKVRGVR